MDEVLAGVGAVALLSGVLGGGFEIKDVKVPKLSNSSRVLCFVTGVVLLSIVLVPRIPEEVFAKSETNHGNEVPPLVEVPRLTGMTAEGARVLLEQQNLVAGALTTREIWAPHGRIIEQSPEAGARIAPGDPIDLVEANSERTYEATRTLTPSNGDEIVATVTYDVKLIRFEDQDQPAGQFMVRDARVTGLGPDINDVIDALRGKPGFVVLSELEAMKLESSWQAYDKLSQDMGHELQLESVRETIEIKSLGPAFMAAMAGVEILFDVKAIFAQVSAGSQRADDGVVLQPGSGIASTIRVDGPSGAAAEGGRARRYDVIRRTKEDEEFSKVGRAVYSAKDGGLRSLDIGFRWFEDEGFYRLVIDRR